MVNKPIKLLLVVSLASSIALLQVPALAWRDDGHDAVALIAYKYLNDSAKTKINALLSADTEALKMLDGRMTTVCPDGVCPKLIST